MSNGVYWGKFKLLCFRFQSIALKMEISLFICWKVEPFDVRWWRVIILMFIGILVCNLGEFYQSITLKMEISLFMWWKVQYSLLWWKLISWIFFSFSVHGTENWNFIIHVMESWIIQCSLMKVGGVHFISHTSNILDIHGVVSSSAKTWWVELVIEI